MNKTQPGLKFLTYKNYSFSLLKYCPQCTTNFDWDQEMRLLIAQVDPIQLAVLDYSTLDITCQITFKNSYIIKDIKISNNYVLVLLFRKQPTLAKTVKLYKQQFILFLRGQINCTELQTTCTAGSSVSSGKPN